MITEPPTRVLMLNNEFPPLGGGTASVNLALFEQFTKMPEAIQIDLITSNIGSKYLTEKFSENITIYKVPVRNKNIHHSSSRELIEYAARALLLALWLRPSRYHSCMAWCTVPAGAVAFLLKIFFRLPYIVRVSGPDLPGFEERYSGTVRVLMPLLKKVWRSAKWVVVKCKEERQLLTGRVDSAQVIVIRNGVDIERFTPAISTPSELQPQSKDRPCALLSVGRLIPRKRHALLIRALHALKEAGHDFRLTIVGDGDERENLVRLVSELKLNQYITFLNYVPRESLPQLYQQADIFVLPSTFEGMSVATLEALASGLPLIITPLSGIQDFIETNECGIIVPTDDIKALSEALSALIINPTLREQLAKNARHNAKTLDWKAVGERYLSLFSTFTQNQRTQDGTRGSVHAI